MPVREQVPLREYTTLRLGGPAARFVTARSDDELIAAVRSADDRGEPVLVLGGGSNLVVADDGFPGTVVELATTGVQAEAGAGGSVAVAVAAGETWDALVARWVSAGLSGAECLAGIPGRCGATPIQNVGAYGQEVAETIESVRAYDRQHGTVVELTGGECGFGYRTSAFKREAATAGDAATGRFVVLGVTFRLTASSLSAPIRYRELASALGCAEGDRVPLAAARACVLGLRRSKGMVLDPADPDTRSAGSFFTNPVLGRAQFDALRQAVAAVAGTDTAVPCFDAPGGQVKVPAAWLIERAGFSRGYRRDGRPGAPRISTKHTLALVNPGEGSTAALLDLAREIRDGVRDRFGVELSSEPVLVGARL